MSRSGYCDDLGSEWALIRWRGAVVSAIRGWRGQAFLRELVDALDRLPERRLIARELVSEGEVCALGAVGLARGRVSEMAEIDPEDYDAVAAEFGLPNALVQEIEYLNDELHYRSPEERWERMRAWAIRELTREWRRKNLGWQWG